MRRDQNARDSPARRADARAKADRGLNSGGLRRGVSDTPRDERPTLELQGIHKNLAKQARTLGDLPEEKFELRVAEAREAASELLTRLSELRPARRRNTRASSPMAGRRIIRARLTSSAKKPSSSDRRRRSSRAWRRARSTVGGGATSTPAGTRHRISTLSCNSLSMRCTSSPTSGLAPAGGPSGEQIQRQAKKDARTVLRQASIFDALPQRETERRISRPDRLWPRSAARAH